MICVSHGFFLVLSALCILRLKLSMELVFPVLRSPKPAKTTSLTATIGPLDLLRLGQRMPWTFAGLWSVQSHRTSGLPRLSWQRDIAKDLVLGILYLLHPFALCGIGMFAHILRDSYRHKRKCSSCSSVFEFSCRSHVAD